VENSYKQEWYTLAMQVQRKIKPNLSSINTFTEALVY
jgi:hypothetical protein